MNIKRAKQEIKDAIEAYLLKDEYGDYVIPTVRQRPVLLLGAPGIGKTQIMEQVARECGVGLVAYTITHHTMTERHRSALYLRNGIWRSEKSRHRIHHE